MDGGEIIAVQQIDLESADWSKGRQHFASFWDPCQPPLTILRLHNP